MTVETTDPVVAVIYGALAYPSQRPAVSTAVDLVAGQPGPWLLDDEDRALTAVALVSRIRAGLASPVADALWAEVVGLIAAAHRGLYDFWCTNRDTLAAPALHEVEQIERTLVAFLHHHDAAPGHRPDRDPAACTPGDDQPAPAAGSEWPSIAEATDKRLDQWIVFLRDHNMTQQEALDALRARATADGKHPPAGLRQVVGHRWLAEMLLHVVADTSTEATQ